MDEPVHWTQQPFDGRPITGLDPAPTPPSPPPSPAPRSNTGLIVAIAAVVIALVGVAVVTKPWSRPSRPSEVATGDSGGFLELDEIPTTTAAPATADDLAARLPSAAALRSLTRQGVAPGTFNARWVVEKEREIPLDEDLAAEGTGTECTSLAGTEVTYERTIVHAPPGTKGEMGDYGRASYIVRRFDTPARAQAWVAAHGTQDYLDCIYAKDHEHAVANLPGPVVDDGIEWIEPAGRGRARRYHATYAEADGRTCTQYTDAYYNQVGSFGLASIYSSCGLPLDPAEGQATVTDTLESLGILADGVH